MRDKKKSEPEKTPEQVALERRVDAMMDPKQPDNPPAEATKPAMPKPAAPKSEPVIAAVTTPISDTPTTAPQLPKPGKKITITDVPSEPLSIDKLDELAERIVGSKSAKSKKGGKPAKSKAAETKAPAAESKTPEKPPKSEQQKTPEPETAEENAPPDDFTAQSTELEDPQTDKAVDDIVAYEGDVMLAVADSTAAEHNRQFTEDEPEEHHVFSTLIWTLVALVVILIIALICLLVMGDSLASKLGL